MCVSRCRIVTRSLPGDAELRKVAHHGVVEVERAALPLLRDRDRRDGLRHGEPGHQRVGASSRRRLRARPTARSATTAPRCDDVQLGADMGAVRDALFGARRRHACELPHDSPTLGRASVESGFTRARGQGRWPPRRPARARKTRRPAPARPPRRPRGRGADPARGRTRGPPIVRFYRSAVGKKWVMAVTGIVLMGFVLAHMIGNLKLYLSKEEINLYGEALRNMPGALLPRTVLLWTIRIVLILAFVFHIHSAAGLTLINRRARPAGRPVPVEARLRRRRLRVAHDALDRHHHPRVPHLPPDGSHVGQRQPAVRARRSVQQPGLQLPAVPVAIVYVVRDDRARVPPVPRHVVDVPEPGHHQPALQRAAAPLRAGLRRVILVGN